MAGSNLKGPRDPKTGDLMTQEQLDAHNLDKFKKSLKAGTLGNTGPMTTIGGTGFGPNRWEKYFNKRPDEAKKVEWKPSDTAKSYSSRAKNRKPTIELIDDIDTKQPTNSKPLKNVGPPVKKIGGIDDIDSLQDTDFKAIDDVEPPPNTKGYLAAVELGGMKSSYDAEGKNIAYEPSRGADKSFETKEQQKARLKKEITERNAQADARARKKVLARRKKRATEHREGYEKDRSAHKDISLDKEFAEFEGNLDNEKLDKEFADFEDSLKKEKLTELAKEKRRQEWLKDMKDEIREDMRLESDERVDKHVAANKGMLANKEQLKAFAILKKAGIKDDKAEELVGTLMSMCG